MDKATDQFLPKPPLHHCIALTMLVTVTIATMLSLSGCNTMQGFGKDVEKAGEAIQKSTK